MLIKPFNHYRIIAKSPVNQFCEWKLLISPEKRAWKLAFIEVSVGDQLEGYRILSVEHVKKSDSHPKSLNYTYSVPVYGNSYTCDICGGRVVNDRCTECMFDWDS